jgi:GNAT superfamily N-acetyltransferase
MMDKHTFKIERIQDTRTVSDYIVGMHREYFCQQLGWGQEFEAEVTEYIDTLRSNFQPNKEGLWVAKKDHKIVGSMAIDGREADLDNARLRIFIVDQQHQHQGIGSALMKTAIYHCRKAGYRRIVLWTFDTLTEARQLYLKNGFKLVEERAVTYWKQERTEQSFVLELLQ